MTTTAINPNNHNCVNVLKNEKRIVVEHYRGFWSVIDDHEGYVLLEHNTYGDETCYLVVLAKEFTWKEFKLSTTGVKIVAPYFDTTTTTYETYDDIITCLEDEGII